MTIQKIDTVIYKGEQKSTSSEPLEKYFQTINRPNFVSLDPSMICRGYYANWLIENKKLYIIDFVGHQLGSKWDTFEYKLSDLFKGHISPILATWFSGDIYTPIIEDMSKSIDYTLYRKFKFSFDRGILISEPEIV